ncbi:MAG: RNA polymerase sigma factor (sigma-70 family) [Myxococcota bacterium]|jgi:RNA polymerase sigma factor (sigma-70 family)
MVAFEALINRWSGAVCAIGLGICRDVAASEEVAQEVFIAVWQGLTELRNAESFGPWVRQLARNKALTHARTDRRRWARVVPDEDRVAAAQVSGDVLLAAEERRVVQEALDALPADTRDVMVLFYREGQSVRQVAHLLELSENAVKKRLSRARAHVRSDVLERFEAVVQRSAPTAALAAAVLLAVSPAPAIAAVSVGVKSGSALGIAGGVLWGTGVIVGVMLGYRYLERVVPVDRIPIVRHARNLSAGGLSIAVVTVPFGGVPTGVGLVIAIAVLGYVQFFVLPKAVMPDPTGGVPDAELQRARMGVVFGAIGWFIGGVCGLLGLYIGASM